MASGAVTAVGNASWADCLQAAGIHTRCGWLSPAARDRVQKLAALLPAVAGGGIECHLADPARADIAIRLSAKDGGRDALLDRHPSLRFAPALTRTEVWTRLQQLGERWARRDTPLAARLQALWLEFDLPAADLLPVPSVFLGIDPVAAALPRDLSWLSNAARSLCGPDLAEGLQAGLQAPLLAAAATGRLTFVGLMLARRTASIRVVLGDLKLGQLVEQAEALGWPGERAGLEGLLREICPDDARLALHLDLSTETGPNLGVELALPGHPRHSPSWARLLRGLIAERACLPQAASALCDWPGLSSIEGEDCQPVRDRAPGGIVRRINHLKVQVHPTRPPLAKAYLYCGLLADSSLGTLDSQRQEEPHGAQL